MEEIIGTPYDLEQDEYWLEKWGVWGDESSAPEWITFVNETIKSGIRFKFSPSIDNVGDIYDLYFTLKDQSIYKSKDATYHFQVQVIPKNNQEFIESQRNVVEFKQDKKYEIIRVYLDKPSYDGKMDIRFSKFIKLP